jgi:hypothetical protein
MAPRTEPLNFRIESQIADRLRRLANENRRGVSDELRAGVEIYLLLVELTNLRANPDVGPTKARELERAIKDEFGRIFLAAISLQAENVFEEDLGVQYPRDEFKEIATPFDRLLDWTVAGRPVTDQELVAEARRWSDSTPVIRPDSRPATRVLRVWARALAATGDESATLARVQQALRLTLG